MSRAVDRREINPRRNESGLRTIIVGRRITAVDTLGSKCWKVCEQYRKSAVNGDKWLENIGPLRQNRVTATIGKLR